jgi:hypothetical protein
VREEELKGWPAFRVHLRPAKAGYGPTSFGVSRSTFGASAKTGGQSTVDRKPLTARYKHALKRDFQDGGVVIELLRSVKPGNRL